jgi:undecaprenyl-diphosphatase
MSYFQSLVLGIIQGLTEFIPVSSTAHLRIIPALVGWDDPGAAYTAVIQLGTLTAALVYFAPDIRDLTVSALRSLVNAEARANPTARLAWAIAAGNIPVIVLGLAFRHFIETQARSLLLIAIMLIVVAVLLEIAERLARQSLSTNSLGFWRAQIVGLAQALALIPGASRSGSTILGGLAVGLTRSEATRFSFLLGLPAIFGAGVFQLAALVKQARAGEGLLGTPDGWGVLAVGLVVAGITGYWSIGFLLRYLSQRSTRVFTVYRIVVGMAILALVGSGLVH